MASERRGLDQQNETQFGAYEQAYVVGEPRMPYQQAKKVIEDAVQIRLMSSSALENAFVRTVPERFFGTEYSFGVARAQEMHIPGQQRAERMNLAAWSLVWAIQRRR